MAELKTKPNEGSVEGFLNGIADERRRQDSFTLLAIMKEVTGSEPKMWGDSVIGFGDFRYRYASGREGDWFATGFSPRKDTLTLYISGGYLDRYEGLLQKLGKHKVGKGCLYIKKLADVDLAVLRELIEDSVASIRETQ